MKKAITYSSLIDILVYYIKLFHFKNTIIVLWFIWLSKIVLWLIFFKYLFSVISSCAQCLFLSLQWATASGGGLVFISGIGDRTQVRWGQSKHLTHYGTIFPAPYWLGLKKKYITSVFFYVLIVSCFMYRPWFWVKFCVSLVK